jgi:hypothetical protein
VAVFQRKAEAKADGYINQRRPRLSQVGLKSDLQTSTHIIATSQYWRGLQPCLQGNGSAACRQGRVFCHAMWLQPRRFPPG